MKQTYLVKNVNLHKNRHIQVKGNKSEANWFIFTKSFLLLFCFFIVNINLTFSQNSESDSTGLPGDHFSLQGALDLFKAAKNIEEFEKSLNTEDNAVNNLDLNSDNNIDYIKVIDNKKDSAHAIVLQTPINETESQDIAVIEIEKTSAQNAVVQIIGDEELYGENMIIEPVEEKSTEKTKSGPSNLIVAPPHVVVNVWFWPSIQFIYAPSYVVWVSPWKWHHYPFWWKPWAPHPWAWHHSHCVHYKAYYTPVYKHRVVVAHNIYKPHRAVSPIVVNRYKKNHETYVAHRNANNKVQPIRAKPNKAYVNKPIKKQNQPNNKQKNSGMGSGKRK